MALLQDPLIEVVIAAVIFISVMVEVKTAGFSGGAVVAFLFGLLLILARGDADGRQMTEMVLYFGGLVLILLDLLFLATGAAAAAGLISIMAALYFLFGGGLAAVYVLAAGVVGAGIGGYFIAGHLSSSPLWRKISLSTSLTKEKGYVSSAEDLSALQGHGGVARTVLRPSGKVEIGGRVLDATAGGDFIPEGTAVVVVRTENNYVVVRRKE